MLALGIVMMLIGIPLTLVGIAQNNNFEKQMESLIDSGKTNPGDTMFYLGLLITIIGLVLFIVGLRRYSQQSRAYQNRIPPSQQMNGGYGMGGGPVPYIVKTWICYRCNKSNLENNTYCQRCGMSKEESNLKFKGITNNKHNLNIPPTEELSNQQASANQESAQNIIEKLDILKKYKELMELGIITREEFEEKKKFYIDNNEKLAQEVAEETKNSKQSPVEQDQKVESNMECMWECSSCHTKNTPEVRCCYYCGQVKLFQ